MGIDFGLFTAVDAENIREEWRQTGADPINWSRDGLFGSRTVEKPRDPGEEG